MITINVSPDEEMKLRQAATRGQEVAEYLLWLARQAANTAESPQYAAEALPAMGQSIAEALQGRIGLFRSEQPSDTARNSEALFGQIMDEKKRQGHL